MKEVLDTKKYNYKICEVSILITIKVIMSYKNVF